MKNALVIGAGRGQVPIINLCQNYGYHVYVVSPPGNYPGLNIANGICPVDIRNYNEIISFAKSKNINAVLTDQLDTGVFTTALVAESLGLRGITTKVATRFSNKYVMRDTARIAGVNVPKYTKVSSICEIETNLSGFNFPLIMKPVDSAASRGVFKVYSMKEIEENFNYTISFSKTSEIIVEEFIEGKEYVIEAYTSNFTPKNLIVGHRDYFDIPDTFIPNATVFIDTDSANSPLEKRLKEVNINLIKAFELPFGITHAEFLYNEKQDKIYLVEIAARGGGVFISSDFIPLSCGVKANDFLVRDALGLPYNNNISLSRGSSAYFAYLTPEGVVCKLDNTDKIETIPGVVKAFFDNIELGMKTTSIKDKSSRKGPILVKGHSKLDCYNVVDEVKGVLDIKIDTKEGIKDIIWN